MFWTPSLQKFLLLPPHRIIDFKFITIYVDFFLSKLFLHREIGPHGPITVQYHWINTRIINFIWYKELKVILRWFNCFQIND